MNKNLLLYWTLIVSKLVRGFLSIGLVVLLGIFIHWHLNPDYYNSVLVRVEDGKIAVSVGKPVYSNPLPDQEDVFFQDKTKPAYLSSEVRFFFNELKILSAYFIFCQALLSIILCLFMVREVIRILKSVQERLTFTTNNIKSFRLLGYLCLVMVALNSIHYLGTNHYSFLSFNPSFTLIGFMLAAFIIAEIFKEGQYLSEQDQLTI